MEAETKVDKFVKSAYTAGFYISSLDNIREAARAARLHWGAGNGPRWHLDAVFSADKSKETGKGAPTQLQALKSIASTAYIPILRPSRASAPFRPSAFG
ncbi:MAG: hypothetical protein LBU32_19290 [Clostridiales bacterium]|nr:hypothetical protein [Clostridiales bacterium]